VRALWALGLAVALGCSGEVELRGVGVRYTPPRGMPLLDEPAGPPPRARFEGGLELLSLALTLDPEVPPAEQLAQVRERMDIPEKLQLASSRKGTLPAGPVTRHELRGGNWRALVYLLLRPDRTVVIRYAAPEEQYGRGERAIEQTLSKLWLTR
jgi:hypothetical protein